MAQHPATERFVEVAEILAAGLMRALALKSSRKSSGLGDVSLDFSGNQSGHAGPAKGDPGYD